MSGGEDPPDTLDLMRGWDGAAVVVRHDEPTGTWMFVALHDDTLGRPTGGCRMKVYGSPGEGLRDAQRLAAGMTRKWAAIDLPFGGGKAVLAVPRLLEGREREGLLRRFAGLLDSLHGACGTGEDLGTSPADMHFLAGLTEHVMGADPVTGEPIDPGPWTALGVFHGMRAALDARTGSASLEGRRVLVEGVGDVGAPLARMVAEEGGRLLLADLRPERARSVAEALGGRVVSPSDVIGTECDVYAPCAVGATLTRESIPRLRCLVVAGSANNQLERAEDADRLHERGILYAPDYVANAGGAMAFGLVMLGERDEEVLRRRVTGLGDALADIFREAEEEEESPLTAARRRVERVLGRAREARRSQAGGRAG
ncbi:MAG: hypothetical protein KY453_01810 [Gemmatimonadetes bacterium]|nr:hypothetical protein [Gemmatimonadota bacterium]